MTFPIDRLIHAVPKTRFKELASGVDYRAVGNNPVNLTDPTGLAPELPLQRHEFEHGREVDAGISHLKAQ